MLKLGIDLGGTNIAAGIVDENGKILLKESCKTLPQRGGKAVVEDMVALGKRLCESHKIGKIGVGAPGRIDETARVLIKAANLYDIENLKLADILEKEFSVPAKLGNDADAAALGEYKYGYAGAKSLIMITLGTGVGGGIVYEGNIISGACGSAGEVGHHVIKAGGEPCGCGRKGCFEAYCSATALIRETKRAMEADKLSGLWQICGGKIDNVDGKTAFDAARIGDKTAKKVLDRYILCLAEGISNLAAIFAPDIFLLGGGISKSGDELIVPLREKCAEILCKMPYFTPVIEQAVLGNDAGIIGAANL